MSLDHLVEKINREASERMKALEEDTEKRLSAMDEELKHRLREFEQKQSDEFRTRTAENKRSLEQEYRNRKKFYLARLKSEMIRDIYAAVEQQLEELRTGEEFPAVLNTCLREALAEYRAERDDEPTVYTHPANLPLLDPKIMGDLSARDDDSLETGIDLRSPDGELRITNTLYSRFEQGKGGFLMMFDTLWKETFSYEQP